VYTYLVAVEAILWLCGNLTSIDWATKLAHNLGAPTAT
jgi:selenocysteine lyase/cysteine desulfurase